ncbi:hypothetical protein SCG7086_AB_00560 [Chlamydiales bacterium SCGC AG-110-P3]|nr:hypothetical protein SCG7086_AB_00560 [Chlamydiales bacterium SCGC AG-110-P3]
MGGGSKTFWVKRAVGTEQLVEQAGGKVLNPSKPASTVYSCRDPDGEGSDPASEANESVGSMPTMAPLFTELTTDIYLKNLVLHEAKEDDAANKRTKLQIKGNGVSNEGLAHLKGKENLKKLELTNCPNITDEGLNHLTEHELTDLTIADCPRITDDGIAALRAKGGLETLNVTNCENVKNPYITDLKFTSEKAIGLLKECAGGLAEYHADLRESGEDQNLYFNDENFGKNLKLEERFMNLAESLDAKGKELTEQFNNIGNAGIKLLVAKEPGFEASKKEFMDCFDSAVTAIDEVNEWNAEREAEWDAERDAEMEALMNPSSLDKGEDQTLLVPQEAQVTDSHKSDVGNKEPSETILDSALASEKPPISPGVVGGKPTGERLHGYLTTDDNLRNLASFDSDLKDGTKMKKLAIKGEGITDAGLKHLEGEKNLKEIEITNCPNITDMGIAALRAEGGLETLNVTNCVGVTNPYITDLKFTSSDAISLLNECLSRVTELNSKDVMGAERDAVVRKRELMEEATRIGDLLEGIRMVIDAKDGSFLVDDGHVEELTEVSARAEQVLKDIISDPSSEKSSISSDVVGSKSTGEVATGLPTLRRILDDTVTISEDKDAGKSGKFVISGKNVVDAELEYFVGKEMPKELELTNCSNITDAGFEHLKDYGLTALTITNCPNITDKGIAALRAKGGLETLSVTNCVGVTNPYITDLEFTYDRAEKLITEYKGRKEELEAKGHEIESVHKAKIEGFQDEFGADLSEAEGNQEFDDYGQSYMAQINQFKLDWDEVDGKFTSLCKAAIQLKYDNLVP